MPNAPPVPIAWTERPPQVGYERGLLQLQSIVADTPLANRIETRPPVSTRANRSWRIRFATA